MNAIILTAVWGVVMMFGGVFFKNKSTALYWAVAGLLLVLACNCYELVQPNWFNNKTEYRLLFDVDVKQMLHFNSFNLTFITVILLCTLLYFLLNGRVLEYC